MNQDKLQKKLNTLLDIINSNVRSTNAKNYAKSIISDLITVINNNEKEIQSLFAWKSNSKLSEIECEMQKYILLLIIYGYSQKTINCIRAETILFIAKNKSFFIDNISPEAIKTTDNWLMLFQFENDRMPKDINEFKKYYKDAQSN